MKTLSLAVGLLSLGLAGCNYDDDSYNNDTAYSNEDVSYDEAGNYPADSNAAAEQLCGQYGVRKRGVQHGRADQRDEQHDHDRQRVLTKPVRSVGFTIR